MRRAHENRRGFALFVVMIVVAVMSVGALGLLDLVGFEHKLVGQDRRSDEARQIADGAVMEVVNDERTNALLPDYSTPGLTAAYVPPATSPYRDSRGAFGYSANVTLIRFATVGESSQNWSRALVYEISADSQVADAQSISEIRARVYRTITVPAGTMLPRVHAR